jgi:hypothetical protein
MTRAQLDPSAHAPCASTTFGTVDRHPAAPEIARASLRDHSSNGARLELRTMRRWRSPESLLLPIGEALAKFVCEEDLANVKTCEGYPALLYSSTGLEGVQEGGAAWPSAAIAPNRPRIAAGSRRGIDSLAN